MGIVSDLLFCGPNFEGRKTFSSMSETLFTERSSRSSSQSLTLKKLIIITLLLPLLIQIRGKSDEIRGRLFVVNKVHYKWKMFSK